MVQATEEQQFAVEKFRTRRPLKISAFAGAGKTTTLKMLARSRRASGLYLAFNKAIAAEAKGKFPKSVDCRTTHSIAFKSVMPAIGSTAKMTGGLYPKQLAEVLHYKGGGPAL
jgi:superfamily II DNA or RNA helicase